MTAKPVTHTPGQWRLGYDEDAGLFALGMASYLEDHGEYISIHFIELYDGVWPEDPEFDEAQANARLIAAAPQMLEALGHIAEDWDHAPDDSYSKCPHCIAQAAIRSAKGKL
jgi:hypothetical protein